MDFLESLMQSPQSIELGRFIRLHREARGLSLRALGAALGDNQVTIMRIERGRSLPSPQKLQVMAHALKVDPSDLYALAGYTAPQSLPDFKPYLLAKYGLSDDAANQLDALLQRVRDHKQDRGGFEGKASHGESNL